jgi:hypothetical protein
MVAKSPRARMRTWPPRSTDLTQEGLNVLVSTAVLKVEGVSGQAIAMTVDTPSGRRTIAGTHILVAAGRRPNTDGIGLEEASVRANQRGFIEANERLVLVKKYPKGLPQCCSNPRALLRFFEITVTLLMALPYFRVIHTREFIVIVVIVAALRFFGIWPFSR